MNHIKAVLKVVLAIACLLQLTACAKTVQWEEEVLLSTGEAIWVKRSDSYVKGGEPGNPLKMTWGIKGRTLEFSRHGQQYKFETNTTAIMMLQELGSAREIVVVAWTRDCQKIGYGEFRWAKGNWQLQRQVDPKLIDQPRNVMGHYSAIDGDIPPRVDIEFKRRSRFDLPQNGGEESHLLASRITVNCPKSN